MLTVLLCVVAAMATVLLVPTSPALIVDMPKTLYTIQTGAVNQWGEAVGLPITVYGVLMAGGVALAMLLAAVLSRKEPGAVKGMAVALISGVFALVCSHLLYCVLRWSYIINDLCESPLFLIQFWKGGYTMYGAVLGALLGVVAACAMMKLPLAKMMDRIVPGMLLVLALGRFGEHFTMQGIGNYVANEALHMIPFVRVGEWGDSQLMVYAYEAIVAAVALVAALAVGPGKAPAGRVAETGLIIISAAQVMLDSWRGDELIRFGFVRLNMIAAAVTLAFIITTRIIRTVKEKGLGVWCILRVVLLLAAAGTVIALEFALDKSAINNTLLYGVMTLAVVLMGAAVMVGDGRKA